MARTNKKPGERKLEMLSKANELFQQKGFQNTTVDDIVKAANVAKGTFYYYFQTKEDVLEAIMEDMEQRGLEKLRPTLEDATMSPRERMQAALNELREYYKNNIGEESENVADLQQRIKYLTRSVEAFSGAFSELVEHMDANGSLTADSPRAYAESLLVISQILLDRTIFDCSDEYYDEKIDTLFKLLETPKASGPIMVSSANAEGAALDERFALMCSPYSRQPLEYARQGDGEYLVCEGERYTILNGIPVCYENDEDDEDSDESAARGGGRGFELGGMFKRMRGPGLMEEITTEFQLIAGSRLLEVGAGRGTNIIELMEKYSNVQFWGVDSSCEALQAFEREMRRQRKIVHLAQCAVNALPYEDNSFDAVFHMGDINILSEDYDAILEMIRVAKPYTRIVIVNDAQKSVKRGYQRIPGVSEKELKSQELSRALGGLLPMNVRDIRLESIEKGTMFKLSFLKIE